MTLHQAETELRMAALAFARARERFHQAGNKDIRARCDAFVLARFALATAALDLAEAHDAEHRVSP